MTKKEAERLAGLIAGSDITNSNEAEAVLKFRKARLMLVEQKIRLVDAWEMPEVRVALDEQMHPKRQDRPETQEYLPPESLTLLEGKLKKAEEDVALFSLLIAALVLGSLATGILAGVFQKGGWDILLGLILFSWIGFMALVIAVVVYKSHLSIKERI